MVPSRSDRSCGSVQIIPSASSTVTSSSIPIIGFPQIRLYSRDLELNSQKVLHREVVTFPVVIVSLVDNSLLVYTADNTLSHYLIVPTADTIKLHLCGSITFNGIIVSPSAVRLLSWMIPSAQKRTSVLTIFSPWYKSYSLFRAWRPGGRPRGRHRPHDGRRSARTLASQEGKGMHRITTSIKPDVSILSREIKKSSTICKFLQIVSSSVGYIFVVSALWRTRYGAMMARVLEFG